MRVKKEWVIAGALELWALTLANWQALGAVRTDEAKYLLNIPYPHPPVMRWVMSMTEWMPFQEMFWRILLASLMVQAVWLLWKVTKDFSLESRIAVCASWLLASAVIIQAGSIMLAPVTALFAVLMVFYRYRHDNVMTKPALIALLWTAMLFTAYQGILFAPLVWGVFRRAGFSKKDSLLFVIAPVILLALYSLSNPLAIATMLIHKNEGVRDSLMTHLIGAGKLWLIGGAGLIGLFGTWSILRTRDSGLILSLLLVAAFVFFSIPYPFYAILFTPLFVAGLYEMFHRKIHPPGFPLLACFIASSAVVTLLARPSMEPNATRAAAQALNQQASEGIVLISGSFGHEWQFESHLTVRRYTPELTKSAQAVVCLNPCEPMFNTSGWRRIEGAPVETWVKK